ncbi:FAD-linked oxidase [Gemmobacter lanyuensis]|uniref:FAD-linked oxidase n=1 Tax=Gemmobacter lanyuensis TaxID=1054497 RepID=A0A918J3D4_9RHOB|nr:FAD-binding and (Fe-S)-binding domain-containing protein [Gemmobacter lanyuensis]GGW42450.1 FAD-linked oxidase [Gemmobacter lanyuensis]
MLDLPPLTDGTLERALRAAGFRGEIEADHALRAAMATDNSVYRILPDLILSPQDSADLACVLRVMAAPDWAGVPLTMRGGGTGTNGQALNRGVILDLRRHMNRLLAVDAQAGWADVEPGMVLDDLNERLRPMGLFFAPETSTSTRCTIGGMVSTDASGKGSRIYGKTSDNILALEIATPEGLLASDAPCPAWARQMLEQAEAAARGGRAAFIAHTPRLNRRFTGYDLDRACREDGGFDWWRLFLGAEGTLGPVTRIRVSLRRIEPEKRLLVVGFDSFHNALAAAQPLLQVNPTAIEVMDETVQQIAAKAGLLDQLPPALHVPAGQSLAYSFLEFNGSDAAVLNAQVAACRALLARLPGASAVHEARDLAEISRLWAVRSAGVGLLGKVEGAARPVAFVEDCVVPPENLPAFVDEFLAVLRQYDLGFGIYGHVDVGCLHIRPALNIDADEDRARLVAVSDAVFELTRKHGGIFWGEHGKGVRGAYLQDWIGTEAYRALQGVKAAFDPAGRYNPGKLVSLDKPVMGIATTPFRAFNAPEGDPLAKAFRCNGNAQCLSYAAATPMCPSFKATADLRHSPKGRADALRDWHRARTEGSVTPEQERDLLAALDGCLGCKACASNCPVQVDIPSMRTVFLADYHHRHRRPIADRLVLAAERFSPLALRAAPILAPVWPLLARVGARMTGSTDLPRLTRQPGRRWIPGQALPPRAVVLVEDWFTALFDAPLRADAEAGFRALGYAPVVLRMQPSGKAALNLGDLKGFHRMARALLTDLEAVARLGLPMIGLDPALVMVLRQDYPKQGLSAPNILLPQEFLVQELAAGVAFPRAQDSAPLRLLTHCTETTGHPAAARQWAEVFAALGRKIETPATGCCGMAGLFGHQARHQAVSEKLFDLSWRQHLQDDTPTAATGFSCRCQAERLAHRPLRHPLGLIANALQA